MSFSGASLWLCALKIQGHFGKSPCFPVFLSVYGQPWGFSVGEHETLAFADVSVLASSATWLNNWMAICWVFGLCWSSSIMSEQFAAHNETNWDLFVTCRDRFQVQVLLYCVAPAFGKDLQNNRLFSPGDGKEAAPHASWMHCTALLFAWCCFFSEWHTMAPGTLKIWLDERSMIPSIVKTNLPLTCDYM